MKKLSMLAALACMTVGRCWPRPPRRSSPSRDAVKYRQSALSLMASHFGRMTPVIKGRRPTMPRRSRPTSKSEDPVGSAVDGLRRGHGRRRRPSEIWSDAAGFSSSRAAGLRRADRRPGQAARRLRRRRELQGLPRLVPQTPRATQAARLTCVRAAFGDAWAWRAARTLAATRLVPHQAAAARSRAAPCRRPSWPLTPVSFSRATTHTQSAAGTRLGRVFSLRAARNEKAARIIRAACSAFCMSSWRLSGSGERHVCGDLKRADPQHQSGHHGRQQQRAQPDGGAIVGRWRAGRHVPGIGLAGDDGAHQALAAHQRTRPRPACAARPVR